MHPESLGRGRVLSATPPTTLYRTPLDLRRLAVAAAWITIWALLALPGGLYSWHYFVTAGVGFATGGPTGGLHLFATHPQLQFGPVSVLAAWLLTLIPPPMQDPVAALFMAALGAVTFALLVTTATALHGRSAHKAVIVQVGAALVPLWTVLAVHFGHLDDALALTLISAGVAAVARGRPGWAVVSLALATGAKPWALPLGVLVLAIDRRWGPHWPSRGRHVHRWGLAAGYLALVVLPWLPFVLADPGTLSIGTFRIDIADDSVLSLLGQTGSTPGWDRPAQLVLATLVALWCVRTGRWISAPLAVLATRMLIDPGTYGYYTAGLAVAAALVDLTGRRPPRLTVAILVWWATDLALHVAHADTLAATLRLGVLITVLVLALTHHDAEPSRARSARWR